MALSIVLLLAEGASACSLEQGYFHQVTNVKGRVVGRSLGPIEFRWLRRMFSVSGAEVTLYNYNQPFRWDKKPPAVAQTRTTSAGEFGFGNIKEGHYRLEIRGQNLYGIFDVEITQSAPATKRIVIDVSPIFPDCTGGHEFEIETEKK